MEKDDESIPEIFVRFRSSTELKHLATVQKGEGGCLYVENRGRREETDKARVQGAVFFFSVAKPDFEKCQ